ncbi:MAG: hypothetical protein WCP69_15385 [Bacteroidota bacterium]
MRQTFLLFGLIFLMQNGYSQTTETFEFDTERFVSPSIEQIISFLKMDYADWQNAMVEYGYEKTSKPGEPAIYSKGQIGDITQTVSKTDLLVSIDWWNFRTDYRTLSSVKKKIEGLYSHSANDIDFYKFQDYIIGISTSTTEQFLMERILIKRNKN